MVASVTHHTPSVAPSVGAWMRRMKEGRRSRPKEAMAANAAPDTASTAVRISTHSGSGPAKGAPLMGLPRRSALRGARFRAAAWRSWHRSRGSLDHLAAQKELGKRRRAHEAEQRDQHRGLEVHAARIHDAEHP